jgi:hypothetical protein
MIHMCVCVCVRACVLVSVITVRVWSADRVVDIDTMPRAGNVSGFQFRQRPQLVLDSEMSKPTLGPTQPSAGWIVGSLLEGKAGTA